MSNEPNTEESSQSDAQSNLNVAAHYVSYLNPFQIHKRSRKVKAYFALAMVCFFWGTTWIASHQGVQYMPALQMAGMRQFFGGMCYVLYFLFRGTPWPKGKDWLAILVLSFLNFMLSNGLSTWGVQYISAGLGAVIGAIFPLWLVVIGLFSNRKGLSAKAIIGLIVGFAGICVIFYEHLHDFLKPDFRFGIAVSLASTWSWAFGTLYTKKHAVHFNPYFGLGLQMVISGITLFTVANASGMAVPITQVPWQSWAAISYLVVFGSVLSFIAYIYALQHLPTEQVSIYAYINPIVAVLLGWMLFGEHVTTFIVVGVLITLYGVFMVNKAVRKMKL